MTRINTIDPKHVLDQHLMAEYREIPMVGASLKRSLKSKSWSESKIPDQYTLNKGHVSFFYNKKNYLFKRFQQIVAELKNRGYDIDPEARSLNWEWFDGIEQIDWEPSARDININLERIIARFEMKPTWYRYNRNSIGVDEYNNILGNYY